MPGRAKALPVLVAAVLATRIRHVMMAFKVCMSKPSGGPLADPAAAWLLSKRHEVDQ
jgi:hypothetical protein